MTRVKKSWLSSMQAYKYEDIFNTGGCTQFKPHGS